MSKFEKNAEEALTKGKANTVGKGKAQPKLSKSAKKVLTECEKHRLFIEHVNSYIGKHGEEVDAYCSQVVHAFMESHDTMGLIEQARALMEADEQEAEKTPDEKLAEEQAKANDMKQDASEYERIAAEVAEAEKALEEKKKRMEELSKQEEQQA